MCGSDPTPCPLPKCREGEDPSTASWLPSLSLGRGRGWGSGEGAGGWGLGQRRRREAYGIVIQRMLPAGVSRIVEKNIFPHRTSPKTFRLYEWRITRRQRSEGADRRRKGRTKRGRPQVQRGRMGGREEGMTGKKLRREVVRTTEGTTGGRGERGSGRRTWRPQVRGVEKRAIRGTGKWHRGGWEDRQPDAGAPLAAPLRHMPGFRPPHPASSHPVSGHAFSLPKIIFPALAWMVLVTSSTTSLPTAGRPFSATTIVPSSR